MSNRYVIEALLRPAVELNTAVVSGMAAYVCVQAPWAVALAPSVSYVTAAGFAALAVTRTHQGMKIIRYRRNLRRLPRYVMSTKQIPVSHRRLFLGQGFRWTQKHTQRLQDTLRPEVARYLQPNRFYLGARQLEMMTEHRLPWLGKLLSADTPLNPVRPLPPVGGNPALHGCISFILAGLKYQPVIMPSGVLVACQRWRPAWPVSCRVRGTARHSANLPGGSSTSSPVRWSPWVSALTTR